MRSPLLIVLFCFQAFFASFASASTNMCIAYLAKKTQTAAEANPSESSKKNKPRTEIHKNGSNEKLTSAIIESENIVNQALNLGLLKKRVAEHLKEDLAELKSTPIHKSKNESFSLMLNEWTSFISEVQKQMISFESLNAQEKRLWKTKMELPVYFASGHFITFLEAGSKDFNYARMYSILKAMRTTSSERELSVFLYLFEKQVLRFFSAKEFKRCRA